MTSPLARVPRAIQMFICVVPLTNRTLPSDISTLAPPGWLLVALVMCEWSDEPVPQPPQPNRHWPHWYCVELGGTIVLNRAIASAPQAQCRPRLVLSPALFAAEANRV